MNTGQTDLSGLYSSVDILWGTPGHLTDHLLPIINVLNKATTQHSKQLTFVKFTIKKMNHYSAFTWKWLLILIIKIDRGFSVKIMQYNWWSKSVFTLTLSSLGLMVSKVLPSEESTNSLSMKHWCGKDKSMLFTLIWTWSNQINSVIDIYRGI